MQGDFFARDNLKKNWPELYQAIAHKDVNGIIDIYPKKKQENFSCFKRYI